MQKLTLICSLCLLSTVGIAQAATPTCNGGTIVTAHSATDTGCTADTCKGTTFCRSNVDMNWFSAWAWCKSQNREMAELLDMCPAFSGETCPALYQASGSANKRLWSKTPKTTSTSYMIDSSKGSSFNYGVEGGHPRALNAHALCK